MRKYTYLLGLIIVLILQSCAQLQDESHVKINDNVSIEVSSQDRSGDWTCYKRHLDYNPEKSGIHMDADYLWLRGNGNLVFKGDSMWYFDYPREFHSSYLLKIQSDGTMITEIDKHNRAFNKLEIAGDSLVRTIGNGDHFVWMEYYVRDTLNTEIIQLLLRDSVNSDELIGRWQLETTIYSEDGSDPWEIDFPFDLPDSLIFSKGEASNINGRIIKLDIEGVSRKFRFGFTENQHYSYHKMWLRPTDWYDGEEVWIHYLNDGIE